MMNLDDWVLNDMDAGQERMADVNIHIKYPDFKPLLNEPPSVRLKIMNQQRRSWLKELLSVGLFKNYQLIGSRISPRGIKVSLPLSLLPEVEKIEVVDGISISFIEHAIKKEHKKAPGFYCVKMTVAIEVEGQTSGMQTVEERYVMIKALSMDDAIQKIEDQKSSYAEPYLNPYGALVSWRIESIDDCFDMAVSMLDELDNPEGVEVFSVLKNRRLKK